MGINELKLKLKLNWKRGQKETYFYGLLEAVSYTHLTLPTIYSV